MYSFAMQLPQVSYVFSDQNYLQVVLSLFISNYFTSDKTSSIRLWSRLWLLRKSARRRTKSTLSFMDTSWSFSERWHISFNFVFKSSVSLLLVSIFNIKDHASYLLVNQLLIQSYIVRSCICPLSWSHVVNFEVFGRQKMHDNW